MNLARASIEPEEIVNYLKQQQQFQEVYQKILYQKVITKAAQERNITITPEEIQAEADRQRREKRLEKAADTLAWLEEQMITPDDWEAGICDRLLWQKLAESLFGQEVEKYFAQNRINFEQVSLYQFTVADAKVAQELFYQIEEREISFYEAANLYDLDENRRNQCGFVGSIDRWELKPDIATAVFSGQIGEVIGPLQTQEGHHLLMVKEFLPAELTPKRYDEILEGMFKEWLDSEVNYMIYS
ncbi:MAG: peptidylprolyl isomerase [Symploca sp. SIO3E6]|nr:peptidylprolyl isomerase [Caldora sp. SIO3E6]